MAKTKGKNETNKPGVQQPVIQVIQDDTIGYCDPVTGLCAVPSPAKAANGAQTSTPETNASDQDKQLSK